MFVDRGLARPDDMPAALSDRAGLDQAATPPALPASLVEELTRHRTVALQVELARRPEIALAAVVHATSLKVFYSYGTDSSLEIRTATPRLGSVAESQAAIDLVIERERWGDKLPGDPDEFWGWCLAQDRDALLNLLAVTVAHSVDAVRHKGETTNSRLRHADHLASALHLDMANWYTPTAENLFGRISKTLTLDAIAEARQQPNAAAWAKLKKPELAALAERHITGTGWLPEPLRAVTPANGETAFSIASDD